MTTSPPSSSSTEAESSTDDRSVVSLDDGEATDPELTGGKASALARARAHGLDTLRGVVLTSHFCAEIDQGSSLDTHPAISEAFDRLAGETPLLARSSSIVEDTSSSSAAGQFETVLGIGSEAELRRAVRTVLDSRAAAGAEDEPIAVLVQPMIEPEVAGVFFGVDPVTGRSDRRVVTAVEGNPDELVSGEVEGARHLVDDGGETLEVDAENGPELDGRTIRQLVDLGDRAEEVFDEPQDIEWARIGGDVVLLQSRPVTSEVRGVPGGPVYGPGPVAETFPERLSPLEEEMWVPPLRDAVGEALRLAASLSGADVDGADLVITVDGYVAIDLERTGEIPRPSHRGPTSAVRRRIRRLRSAWRVGRLRSALPALADRLLDRVDGDLESIPRVDVLTDRQLVALIGRGRAALRSVHAHEILMGLLIEPGENRMTGASVAMRVLAEARTDGSTDEEIVTRSPVVLALTPPRIAPTGELPEPSKTPDLLPGTGGEPASSPERTPGADVAREALRLRARWLQELTARAAWELGERLAESGRLEAADDVRFLPYDQLALLVTGRVAVDHDQLTRRRTTFENQTVSPLPARFQLGDRGRPIPVRHPGQSSGGTGAGGGEARGPVTHDTDDPPQGAVLVVNTLSPGLGPLLTRLSGVVAETGSVLAHLAILARESGVACVVGHAGALEEFSEGTTVVVDGATGQVSVEDDEGGAG